MLAKEVLWFSLLFTICVPEDTIHSNPSWDYRAISLWSDLYPECGSNRQSPIDVPVAQCDDPIVLDVSGHHVQHYIIRNSGLSLRAIPFQLSFLSRSFIHEEHDLNESRVTVKNPFYHTYRSPINSEYCLDSIHFHWSLDDEHGSDHLVNGHRYPLEAHLVHFSCDFESAEQALEVYQHMSDVNSEHDTDHDTDDHQFLSVVAVFFEVGEANELIDNMLTNTTFEAVRDYQPLAAFYEQERVTLEYSDFDIADLLPDNKEIVSYMGSLTTPPCYETVRWLLMKNTMTVSEQQLQKLRALSSNTGPDDLIAPNYRSVQRLNDRKIYQCQSDIDEESVEKDTAEFEYASDDEIVVRTVRDGTWFIIGTTFICLFGFALCINLHFMHWYCAIRKAETEYVTTDQSKGDYSKVESKTNLDTMDTDNVDDEESQHNNQHHQQ